MNIGFDAKRLFNNFTGLGNYSRFIVQAMADYFPENHYHLFTPKIKRHPEIDYFLNKENISTVVPPPILKFIKGGGLWRTCCLGKESRRRNIALYHGLSNELPHDIGNTKSVVTIHDLIFMRFPQFYKSVDVAIYKAKARYAVKVADRIIAISHQTASDIVELLHVKPEKIEVVYQGCHPNFRRVFTDAMLEHVKVKYDLPENFILNVGTIEERKNALVIVKALALLPKDVDAKVVIVGRPTSYLKTITDFIDTKRLHQRVKILQNVTFEDLPAIYRLSRVFVYPSLFEGFGIPLIEAITCGVPVITSSGGCFSEAAGPDAVYIDPYNEEELAMRLKTILSDDAMRDAMVRASRKYISRFEPVEISRELYSIYASLV